MVVPVADLAAELAAVTISLATDFPAAATPFSTPIALLRSPTVSEMAAVESLPARIVSSTPSVKRVKMLALGAGAAPCFVATNST